MYVVCVVRGGLGRGWFVNTRSIVVAVQKDKTLSCF